MGRKDSALRGITDRSAIALFQNSKIELETAGRWNAATEEMLRSAAQWTQDAADITARIRTLFDDAGSELALQRLIKNRRLCESERDRILDALLLTPQKPRGRPPKEADPEDEDDGGWAAFDEDERR